jgi:arylsulfatase A-like enzyme
VNPIVTVPAKGPPPDIILVLLDDLRADHLGCYGYPRNTSAFPDSLAERGVVFEDATAQATWTFASVRGMLTSAHRLATFAPDLRTPDMPGSGEAPRSEPPAMVTSLPGELRKAGYETMGCVGGGFLDPRFGCDTGFDWYWSPTTTPMLGDQLSAVKKRLETTKPQPFFLLLHTYEVHHYRDGRGHGLEQFDRGYTGELKDGDRLRQALEAGLGSLSAADLEHVLDLYDGEIWHSDRQLRSFFDWLLDQPWARDAIVVITSDHGEAFGEHGLTWHGGPPYRELAHVPLILYRPAGRWQGRRIRQPVSLADLAPTLLDLAGARRPGEMVGRTLVPLAAGKAASGRPMLCGSETAVMVRDGPLWYMSWRGTRGEELYDVDRDPGQERNLAGSDPTARAKMRRVLAELAMQASHGYRLAVVGPRDEPLVIETTSTEGFSYFDVPTLRAGDRVKIEAASGESKAQRKRKALYEGKVKVVLAAGDDPHVILFEPATRGATVRVEAETKTGSVRAERFHLGSKGSAPRGVPVVIGRGDAEGWGIWLWRPSGAATEAQESGGGTLSENLEKQLRSLGYLK